MKKHRMPVEDFHTHAGNKFHGSPKETHKIHGGEIAAPKPLPAQKPGKASGAGGNSIYGKYYEGGAESYKPKKMRTYTEE